MTGAANGLRVETRVEVRVLVLDRPQAANALGSTLQHALTDALAEAAGDSAVAAVLLMAAGDRVFSAGADLKEFSERDAGEARTLRRELLRVTLLALIDFGKPLVAAVRGKAIGAGCMLAFLADEVHAADGATFWLPEIRLGMATPVGASIVAARGGRRAALSMALGGEAIDARAALGAGLIDAAHPAAELQEAALARARALAAHAGAAYAQNKRWINAALRDEIIRALDHSAHLTAQPGGATIVSRTATDN